MKKPTNPEKHLTPVVRKAIKAQSDFLQDQLKTLLADDEAVCCPQLQAQASDLGYERVCDYVAARDAAAAAQEQGFATASDYLASLRGDGPSPIPIDVKEDGSESSPPSENNPT